MKRSIILFPILAILLYSCNMLEPNKPGYKLTLLSSSPVPAMQGEELTIRYHFSGPSLTNGCLGTPDFYMQSDTGNAFICTAMMLDDSIMIITIPEIIKCDNLFCMVGDIKSNKLQLTVEAPPVSFFDKSNSTLPSLNIKKIVIDNRDIKWILTDKGLARLEGKVWSIFNSSNSPLPVDNPDDILLDKEGYIWFAHGRKLYRFDETNVFVNSFDTIIDRQNNFSPQLAIDSSGNKWIGVKNELIKFDGVKWTKYPKPGIGEAWFQGILASQNFIWAIISNEGLARFDGKNWKLPRDDSYFYYGHFMCAIVKSDEIWAGGGGLVVINGNNSTRIKNPDGHDFQNINSMAFDNAGVLWIGSLHDLYRYDGNSSSKILYHASWCELGSIHTIATDKNGDKWVGAENGIKIFRIK